MGSTEPEAIDLHIRESLAAAPFLPSGARVVDLGSGAGLPGIPLAIVRPDLDVTLVEIRERRSHFLRHALRRLGVQATVERRRIEEGPAQGAYDFALMRAVAPRARARGLARPWLEPGGELWIWTTEGERAEEDHAPSIPLERGRIARLRP